MMEYWLLILDRFGQGFRGELFINRLLLADFFGYNSTLACPNIMTAAAK
jgi:hypothetical protein